MRGLRQRVLALLLLCASSGWSWRAEAIEAVDELPLKAAIAYNLLLFTQWPDEASWPPGNALVVCADPAGRWWPLLQAMQDRPVRQSRLSLRAPGRSAEGLASCHVVLLDGALRAGSPGRAQLVLADESDSGSGWTVRLSRQNGRVVFDVDLVAARAAHLQISSKALRLAREVVQ